MNIHLQVLYTTSTLIIGGITNIQTKYESTEEQSRTNSLVFYEHPLDLFFQTVWETSIVHVHPSDKDTCKVSFII